MELLMLLVERRNDLVSRADIVKKLWGDDVFVDVDMGVNTAIRKVRQALGDSPDATTYVTTVSGKGYRFTAAVEDADRSGSTRPATPERMTIAVLPFENLSADPDREYLADGLTEEAIAVLGQIDPERIAVIGRTSVTAYRKTTKALADIGRELGARYLVESSIRSEGGRLRITSKLIRAADQAPVWSATFDSEPDSLLEFQRELCSVLATQIHLTLSPLRLDAIDGRHTRDAEAYHVYLQGRYFSNQLTPATTRRALECYTRATKLDPEYALAWSGLADAYSASPINGDADPRVVTPLARAAADHAVTSKPTLAEAQVSVGILHYFLDWNWPKAEAALRRAIELDPNLAMGHRMLGILLASMTRHDEARAAIRRARELDPLYVMNQSLSSQIAFFARDYDAAIHFARQAVVVDSSFWIGYLHLGQAFEQAGDLDKALAALDHAGRLSGNSKPISLRGYIFARQHRTDDARDVLRTLEAIARERYVPAYAMALVHAGLGDRDAAFEWLERAFQTGDVHLLFVPADPKWDAFRNDARLNALIAKCGFAA
jgi:TolB-like protein/Flp pilus assembly protein TadD